MSANVGGVDRSVRVVLGIALLSLYFVLEGNLRYLGFIGLVPLLTAAIGYCPLYALLGINTCPTKVRANP
jgi:hypothetical protein